MKRVFVTGATGLLGNNLVRALNAKGIAVRALVRSADKAKAQLSGLANVEWVIGDMTDIAGFAAALHDCDTVFHTAAFFRDSYKGGRSREALERINIEGTARFIETVYQAGIRRFIHTSSTAVLCGKAGAPADETNDRDIAEADDYFRSKILSERAIRAFLETHRDMHAVFVLPGWMWGPGDAGPTSAGQLALDVMRGKLPGLVPGGFSFVDARDVALAHIAAAERGRSGERYLAAGRHMKMHELVPMIGEIGKVATPTRRIPLGMLYVFAGVQELIARITGKPVLISLAVVRLIDKESDRTYFSSAKSERELAVSFRPATETVRDTIAWYRANGWLPA